MSDHPPHRTTSAHRTTQRRLSLLAGAGATACVGILVWLVGIIDTVTAPAHQPGHQLGHQLGQATLLPLLAAAIAALFTAICAGAAVRSFAGSTEADAAYAAATVDALTVRTALDRADAALTDLESHRGSVRTAAAAAAGRASHQRLLADWQQARLAGRTCGPAWDELADDAAFLAGSATELARRHTTV